MCNHPLCANTHRRDERKRHEEALDKVSAEGAERVKAAQEEGKRERETLRKAHEKQVGREIVNEKGSHLDQHRRHSLRTNRGLRKNGRL
jgi:vacuolar-type H+-ATPase subunit H